MAFDQSKAFTQLENIVKEQDKENFFFDFMLAFKTLHVPAHSDHPFRFNPITDFGLIRSPISVLSDQK